MSDSAGVGSAMSDSAGVGSGTSTGQGMGDEGKPRRRRRGGKGTATKGTETAAHGDSGSATRAGKEKERRPKGRGGKSTPPDERKSNENRPRDTPHGVRDPVQGDTSASDKHGRKPKNPNGGGQNQRNGKQKNANGDGRGERQNVSFKDFYEEWLSSEEVHKGIEAGELIIGTLRISGKNRREGYVKTSQCKYDVYIGDERSRNRALQGDVVAVRLLPREEWHERNGTSAEDLETITEVLRNAKIVDDEGLWQPRVLPNSSAAKSDEKDEEEAQAHAHNHRVPDEAKEKQIDCGDNLQPRGEVVAVLVASEEGGFSVERSERSKVIGTLVPQFGFDREGNHPKVWRGKPLPAEDRVVEFHPINPSMPWMIIARADTPDAFLRDPWAFAPPDNGQLFEATLTGWSTKHRFPSAKILRMVGEAGEIGPETEALLIENNCDHGDFPEEAIEDLRAFAGRENTGGPWRIPEEEIARRRDLRRSHRIFTIDPLTAKDLDDALSIVAVPAGRVLGTDGRPLPAHYEVGVHIADVSYFVTEGTALDREANRRATTVYLVNKVIPMLPPLLSEELCSLNPGVDRLAFSTIWRMTADGEMLPNQPQIWFGRTVIRSCAKLDYGLAQRMVDGSVTATSGDEGPPKEKDDSENAEQHGWPASKVPESPHTKQQVIDDVRMLVAIAMERRKKRFSPTQGGALQMRQVKMSFRCDSQGNPLMVRPYPLHDTNRAIEEYMLLANYVVSQQLILFVGKRAFIRHHPPPEPASLANLVKLLEEHHISVDPSALATAHGLQVTLEQIERAYPPLLAETAHALLRKPMRLAQYAAAGTLLQRAWRHFSLNMPTYTHFTSPIRRYADTMVHRQLAAVCTQSVNDDLLYSVEEVQNIAEHCNEKKEASKKAQDASDRLFLALLVRQQFRAGTPVGATAVVLDLGPQSFDVFLVEFGVEMRLNAAQDFHGSRLKPVYAKEQVAATAPPLPPAIEERSSRHRRGGGRGGSRGGRGGRGGGRGEPNDKKKVRTVESLTMSVVPLGDDGQPLPSGAQQITIVKLARLAVLLHPKIVNDSRLSFVPRFKALQGLVTD